MHLRGLQTFELWADEHWWREPSCFTAWHPVPISVHFSVRRWRWRAVLTSRHSCFELIKPAYLLLRVTLDSGSREGWSRWHTWLTRILQKVEKCLKSPLRSLVMRLFVCPDHVLESSSKFEWGSLARFSCQIGIVAWWAIRMNSDQHDRKKSDLGYID
jgi:hypothetical protein